MVYGIFSDHFITNFLQNVPLKIFENRSIFGELPRIYGQKFAAYFSGTPCAFLNTLF